ncbi:MAG: DUF2461 domain-containing protein [Flavobacteriaceae bacterium]|nr:DUF2461 domain-containing protein [Flavobacteriaceae bacterium]
MTDIVSKEMFSYLNDLSNNNNREWFIENKDRYELVRKGALAFFNKVLENLIKHDEMEKLKFFRIYRDVRFSKNKTPYKTHFGCQFIRYGKALRGGYYVHLEPNKSFIGCGFWAPEKEDLLRIRKEIEFDGEHFMEVIKDSNIKKYWGEIYEGESLKVAPKGFDKKHPYIKLLRKKQFVFVRNFSDEKVFREDFVKQIAISFQAMRPFLDLMSTTLTTDLNGESIL